MLRPLVAICVLLAVSTARAEEISDQEVSRRLAWLDHSLERGAIVASSWWGGWMSYAIAEGTFGWLRYARTGDRLDRDLWLVTGVGSTLWVAQLLLFPLDGAYAPLRLQRMPRGTPGQRRLALARAEDLLERSARSERESLHWTEHVLDLAWAFGSAAYIFGRNYDRVSRARLYREAGIELGLTILLTEAAILSTPRRAIRDLERYKAYGPSWNIQLSGTSVSWTVRF